MDRGFVLGIWFLGFTVLGSGLRVQSPLAAARDLRCTSVWAFF